MGSRMSPRSSTTRPWLRPSSGQVSTKPLGQWSQRPGSSTKPYSQMAGNSPKAQRRSVPAAEVMCICLAASMRFDAACTRARSASVGTRRHSTSGGSTASRILVPVCRISCCSGGEQQGHEVEHQVARLERGDGGRVAGQGRGAQVGQRIAAERLLGVDGRQVQPVDARAQVAGGRDRAAQRLRMRVGAREHGDRLAGLEPGQREHLLPGVDQIVVADGHAGLLGGVVAERVRQAGIQSTLVPRKSPSAA